VDLTVGVIANLTGSGATTGASFKAGVEVAKDDVNAYLAATDARFRLVLAIEDGASSADTALGKLKDLAARGVKAVIGPQSSSQAAALKGYASDNGILLISPTSALAGASALGPIGLDLRPLWSQNMTMTVKTVPAGEFKAKCLALLDEVSRTGEVLIITKRGKPVARVMRPETAMEVREKLRGSVITHGDIVSPSGAWDEWDPERGFRD
jgi:prevent-host-death family protein